MSDAPIRIFYSYSREDDVLRKKLDTFLKPLAREGLIETWADQQLSVGTEWDAEIRRKLDEADIILLLVSPDFMASDYIWDTELKAAMERHEQGTARVVPVILRPTELKKAKFMKLSALPPGLVPVAQWPSLDEALLKVAQGIRQVAEALQAKRRG